MPATTIPTTLPSTDMTLLTATPGTAPPVALAEPSAPLLVGLPVPDGATVAAAVMLGVILCTLPFPAADPFVAAFVMT